MKDSIRVLVALVVALILGTIIAAAGNATLVHWADALTPIGILWVNAIRMTVIPLVVSLIITGVASTAALHAIGRIGRRTIVVFLALVALTAVIAVPVLRFVFSFLPQDLAHRPPLPPGATEAAAQITSTGTSTSLVAWLTSLIPTNPIGAAANGAMLPLIVFTLLLALAITRIPTAEREQFVGWFQALGDALLVLVHWIIALAPIGVFALVLPIAVRGGAGLAGGIGFYVVVYSTACIGASLLLYPVVTLWGRVPIGRFARAALPPQLIAFSTSSSIASLPALIDTAKRNLDMDDQVSGFVLPLSVAMYKISAPVSWTAGALFIAWFYGVHLGVRDLATVAVASVVLTSAGPGVPRGAFLMLAPLFVAIGLPVEGIGILIAVDAIPDLFSTVLNVTGDLAAAAIVGKGRPLATEGP